MASTKVTVRMDEADKAQLESVLAGLGMNLTTGINVFAKSIIRHGGFPFELSDPFFSKANLARIEAAEKHISEGKLIFKTDEELGLNDV